MQLQKTIGVAAKSQSRNITRVGAVDFMGLRMPYPLMRHTVKDYVK